VGKGALNRVVIKVLKAQPTSAYYMVVGKGALNRVVTKVLSAEHFSA